MRAMPGAAAHKRPRCSGINRRVEIPGGIDQSTIHASESPGNCSSGGLRVPPRRTEEGAGWNQDYKFMGEPLSVSPLPDAGGLMIKLAHCRNSCRRSTGRHLSDLFPKDRRQDNDRADSWLT